VSRANGKSERTMNYIEVGDIVLVKACESVTLDAVTDNDQIGKKYWKHIEDKFTGSCRHHHPTQ
jgi:hypothetical protein